MKRIAFAFALAAFAPLAANAAPLGGHDQLVAKINAAYNTNFATSAPAQQLRRMSDAGNNTRQSFSNQRPAPAYGAGQAG